MQLTRGISSHMPVTVLAIVGMKSWTASIVTLAPTKLMVPAFVVSSVLSGSSASVKTPVSRDHLELPPRLRILDEI